MHVNILHRPEPDPYRKEIFKLEQDMVHNLGLKSTILATAPALVDEDTIMLMKKYHEEYGDEAGISFHTLDSPNITDIVGYKDAAIWMYTKEDKRRIIRYMLDKFVDVFGFTPESAASYHFDSSTLNILLEECPTIKTVVAGCFEEGVRVYHGCNNSWYLFNEGMPWGPWYPSKNNSLRPAKDSNDAAGVVAVPHLTRDMVLAYEGRNDFWASHPPNVQRGMGNRAENCPYDKNLIDQHKYQEKFNNGYSYLNIFVSAQWLIYNHNSEEPPEVSISLYRQQLEYVKSLVDSGKAVVSTMSEFGKWYKENIPVNHNEVSLAKEVLYGSGKHYFWYINPKMRVLFDLFQGASIGDLRPYIAEIPVETGADTEKGVFGSYPYIIQSQHRTGYLNHFADGSRTTLIMRHGDIDVDMADVELKCHKVLPDNKGFTTKPVSIQFGDSVTVKLKNTIYFEEAKIIIEREILSIEGSDVQEVLFTEYLKGCYGITEYPEDMKGISLTIDGDAAHSMNYIYKRRCMKKKHANYVEASVPQINTIIGLQPIDNQSWNGTIEEGILFNPYYTLKLSRKVETGKTSKICLYLKTIR